MNPVQYIILNKGAGMSTGKAVAQGAHASQMGLLSMVGFDTTRSPYEKSIANRWMRGGHYAKVTLEVADAEALKTARDYIEARGFTCFMVIDEGRTEIDALTLTAIGTEIVDKDQPHVRETFGVFKLYQDRADLAAGLDLTAGMRPEPDKLTRHEPLLKRLRLKSRRAYVGPREKGDVR